MALNLRVDAALGATAQSVKDENGGASQLALSLDAVGIGTTKPEGAAGIVPYAAKRVVDVNKPDWVEGDDVQLRVGDLILDSRHSGSSDIEADNQRGTNGNLGLGAKGAIFFYTQDTATSFSIKAWLNNDGKVGIGTATVGKEFEVVGNIVSRASAELGATAVVLAAEDNGLGSLWTNNGYNPANAGSGWKRTINLKNGNVGIGGSKSPEALNPEERLVVAGNILATGDVRLAGADCAEDFDVEESIPLEPGMVMVIGAEERLHRCNKAYDRRVAGVLSGAGHYRPGIILGKQAFTTNRLPLALTGKVYCKVDAGYSPICEGDLLTTSPTTGHAMKASDATRAFGAVLGKALRPMLKGAGLIPVLVCLH